MSHVSARNPRWFWLNSPLFVLAWFAKECLFEWRCSPFFCDYYKPGCGEADYSYNESIGEFPWTNPPLTSSCGEDIGTGGGGASDMVWRPSACGVWQEIPAGSTYASDDDFARNKAKCFDTNTGERCFCLGSLSCARYPQVDFGLKIARACGRWSDLFGMYMGDGATRATTLTTYDIDYSCDVGTECNAITGNFIIGRDRFTHSYEVRQFHRLVKTLTPKLQLHSRCHIMYQHMYQLKPDQPCQSSFYVIWFA